MKLNSKNIKLLLNYIVVPVILVWLAFSIYKNLSAQTNLTASFYYIIQSFSTQWVLWLIVLLLMMVNWSAEAIKWKILLNSLESISFLKALRSVVAGITIGMGTPQRIGETGGRLMYVSKTNRMAAIPLTMVASWAQLFITLTMGITGLFMMKEWMEFAGYAYLAAFVFVVLSVVAFFIVRSKKKEWKIVQGFNQIKVSILLRVLTVSAFRYGVFVLQFILLLKLANVEVGLQQAYWLISIMYLILACIPGTALIELGIRGQAGILLFENVSTNLTGVYAASVGIWLVNVLLPALAGWFVLLIYKYFKPSR